MPNNVRNYLWIDGPQNEVKRFFKCVNAIDADNYHSSFTFNELIPMPNDVKNSNFRLDWSIKNWGTKWDAYDINVDIDNQYIQYTTAWNIPKPFLIEISNKFPDLIIVNDFIEEILEHAGSFKYSYEGLWSLVTSNFYDWKLLNKKCFIHSLNLKYSKDLYIYYLNELKEDARIDVANAAKFYLNLIERK